MPENSRPSKDEGDNLRGPWKVKDMSEIPLTGSFLCELKVWLYTAIQKATWTCSPQKIKIRGRADAMIDVCATLLESDC